MIYISNSNESNRISTFSSLLIKILEFDLNQRRNIERRQRRSNEKLREKI